MHVIRHCQVHALPCDPLLLYTCSQGTEEIDFGLAKQFEIDVAEVLQEMGVALDHPPSKTGRCIGDYNGVNCHPDITGSINGKMIVVDTKKRDKSYITSGDISKLERDSEAMGGAYPIMINSGTLISSDKENDMNALGLYIEVPYPYPGWREVLKKKLRSAR